MSDGKTLLYKLRTLINEDSASGFLDDRTSYDFLNEGAKELVRRSSILTNTQSITTVADQSDYTLNANFTKLYLKDKQNRLYIKYNDGTNNTFIYWRDFEDVVYEDNTASVTIPNFFTITDDQTLDSQVSGTTTSAGASSGGEATLTDTTADFSDVSAGSQIHNTTDDSDGVVLSKTSSTVLVCALFGGTDNDFTSGDSYVIQPQGRYKLIFNPPTSTAGHTATVSYVERPTPVYSDYGMWRFTPEATDLIIDFAAAKYKYRDTEFSDGDKFFQQWGFKAAAMGNQFNKTFNRRNMSVNFKARRW